MDEEQASSYPFVFLLVAVAATTNFNRFKTHFFFFNLLVLEVRSPTQVSLGYKQGVSRTVFLLEALRRVHPPFRLLKGVCPSLGS